MFVAVLALLAALLSVVLSWRAAGKAGDAVAKIDKLVAAGQAAPVAPPPSPADTAAAPTGPVDQPTDAPTDQPTGSVPTLNAQTPYKISYTDQEMTIPAGCNTAIYVDLDEPRVQVEYPVSELTYSTGCGAGSVGKLQFRDGVDASSVQSAAVTPVDCAEDIRKSPLSNTADQPVRQRQVYCVKTSSNVAAAAGVPWKMVVLSVTSVSQNGAVSLKASAWDIPR